MIFMVRGKMLIRKLIKKIGYFRRSSGRIYAVGCRHSGGGRRPVCQSRRYCAPVKLGGGRLLYVGIE